MNEPLHVVVIGSGFGGLFAAKALRRADVRVTLIAKTAHHLFQPLLYQVATGILSEGDIAPATRELLRRHRNTTVLQGLVTDVDLAERTVLWRHLDEVRTTTYDQLVVAAGAGQSYFGHPEFETFAPGMKSLDDALELRARIFGAFERAEIATDDAARARELTFVVVGGGPTGVEMAGQIRELATTTLAQDFRRLDPRDAKVVLLDGATQILPAFGSDLGARARRALENKGVDVRLQAMVRHVGAEGVTYADAEGAQHTILCGTTVWAAGVQASPLGALLATQCGLETDRAGRVPVAADLSLPGHGEVFVVGDLAAVPGVPGVAQGAIQGARYAARLIAARAKAGDATLPAAQPFAYVDKGSMATISKFRAVVSVGTLRLSGFVAWVMWLVLHLFYIAGFKQRVSTLLQWAIAFLSDARNQRAYTHQQLVGRLALERLGQHVSAPLLEGQHIDPRWAGPRETG